ncbi:hypothetical protein T10_1463 [Trichinella papuae]|uniref:Uncharacterized protein n=1 Tax=Trichinella papuae TaxID=268474 RepID=A0A0V1MPV4_9BILA|nr:hypothetical protein T10_1463 [Trichinella papuae]
MFVLAHIDSHLSECRHYIAEFEFLILIKLKCLQQIVWQKEKSGRRLLKMDMRMCVCCRSIDDHRLLIDLKESSSAEKVSSSSVNY